MTANQMKYLVTLMEQEEKKRSLSAIAKLYGVNKSSVSRALSVFIKHGILDENNNLTPYGQAYLAQYKYRYDRIVQWLGRNGIDEDNARKDAFELLEVCSEETIQLFVGGGEFCKACSYFGKQGHKQIIEGSNLIHYVREGEYKVPFVFHKDKRRSPEHISMANNAFHHPGKLIIRKNGSHLCLKMKSIKKSSVVKTIKLEGKLKTMKYEKDGGTYEVMINNESAFIPIDALKFIYIKEDNILQGFVRLTMSATVANFHMPESTAILTVYL